MLKKYKKFKPFIIKIDIEGFENNLFKKNIEWMDKFKIIIIEIHDWMIPSKSISNNLVNSLAKISKKNKRDLIIQGENLISIKNKLIMKILVTGGLGYIGSNMTLELLKLKNKVIVLDNLSNSNKSVINKIKN